MAASNLAPGLGGVLARPARRLRARPRRGAGAHDRAARRSRGHRVVEQQLARLGPALGGRRHGRTLDPGRGVRNRADGRVCPRDPRGSDGRHGGDGVLRREAERQHGSGTRTRAGYQPDDDDHDGLSPRAPECPRVDRILLIGVRSAGGLLHSRGVYLASTSRLPTEGMLRRIALSFQPMSSERPAQSGIVTRARSADHGHEVRAGTSTRALR